MTGALLTGPLTLVFTKRPCPGEVKTRLCPPLSFEQAAGLALAMLDDLLERCCARSEFATGIAAAPSTELEWFRERYPAAATVIGQRGKSMDQRLAALFSQRSQGGGGIGSRVLIGSDAPLLSTDVMLEAHRRLSEGLDAIFVPDQGGGYCLVGLARPTPDLFLDVRTSTDDNLERTLERARSLGLECELLPAEHDIDQPEDLRWILRRAVESPVLVEETPTRTFELLRSLGPVLR